MPIVIPILGAEEAPAEDVVYVSEMSLDVLSGSIDTSESDVDVLSLSAFEAGLSIEISRDTADSIESSVSLDSYATDGTDGSMDITAGDGFMILADVLDDNLAGTLGGSYGFIEINAKLLVNGSEVKIKSFQYQVPTGRLGSILNVRLAKADVSLVPAGASIKFSLIIKKGGGPIEYVLIEDGKLQDRSYQISYAGPTKGPQDEVSFSSLDVITDKFGLGPRRPVVMFDPYRVRYDQVSTRNDQLLRDEHGTPIVPIIEPVGGLTMKQILNRAYTGTGGNGFITPIATGFSNSASWLSSITGPTTEQIGCGFTAVVTNIPDYPVRRADFTIEGGWHGGASAVTAMYAPIFFVDGTVLFIIDVERPLPAGITAHQLSLAEHKTLTERLEYKPDNNAVLLTYQYNGNDPAEDPTRVSRDVFHPDVVTDESGTVGEAGYSKTTVRRWDREFYMTDTPTEVLDTLPLSSETETQQSVVWYDDAGTPLFTGTRITHQETITYQYDGDLKVGHIRTTRAAVADPGAGHLVSLVTVEEETCTIDWTEDPNHYGVKLQDRVRIDTMGLCAYDPTTTETVIDEFGTTEFSRNVPILLAQSSGILTTDWVLQSQLIPIKTIRETLHNMKGTQLDVEVIETDLLNNTLKRSYTQPTTGTTKNDPFEVKSRTRLLRDTASEADIGPRVPVSVNAYELPRVQALELGHRVLRRLSNPLFALPVVLPGVDLTIRQGSVVRGQKRSGYTSNYFVTGFSINGDSLGHTGHRISQTLEGAEIPSST